MYVLVIPDIPKVEKPFWYASDNEIKGNERIAVGSIVRINFRNRRVRAWVVRIETDPDLLDGIDEQEIMQIKKILEYVSDGPPPIMVDLSNMLAQYYLVSPVIFLRMCSPQRIMKNLVYNQVMLSDERNKRENVYLVDPRTDRRNTIAKEISSSGSTIIVLPDSHERFSHWIQIAGHNVIRYSPQSRSHQQDYHHISQGSCVVVGGRSALFAPVPDCESIVVVDDSYEQLRDERSPYWHSLDVARLMGSLRNCSVSAVTSVPSPSIYGMNIIDQRTAKQWPRITIENHNDIDPVLGHFSKQIVNTINGAAERHYDSAIIVNTIAAAKTLICSTCGEIAVCDNCSRSVKQNDIGDIFSCPLCLKTRAPVCISCKGTIFRKYRKGIKSIVHEARSLFPRHHVCEIYKNHFGDTGENTNRPRLFIATESLFHHNELTASLACCIFLDFDTLLFRPHVSAFNSSCVIVNRALRAIKNTDITHPLIISTHNIHHEIINDIQQGDFLSQYNRELKVRSLLGFAPLRATVEVTSTPQAINELHDLIVNDEISRELITIVGKKTENDLSSILLTADNHDLLSLGLYEKVRHIASSNRCTVGIDI